MEGCAVVFRLQTPLSLCLVGPSMCGKTTQVFDILYNRKTYFDHPITKIIYVYYKLNSNLIKLAESDSSVVLVDSVLEGDKNITENCILVLDDCMTQLKERDIGELVTDYFTRKVHHFNFNVILTLQRAFTPQTRTILDNTRMAAYFDCPRSRSQITYIARNFAPKNIHYVQHAYAKAIAKPHGFLVFNYSVGIPESQRLRNFIYPRAGDENFLYTAA
jgi:hypothetical protein